MFRMRAMRWTAAGVRRRLLPGRAAAPAASVALMALVASVVLMALTASAALAGSVTWTTWASDHPTTPVGPGSAS
ncbi:hypothetical protein ACIOC2_28455, partial [Streptomyces sp. NPDC088337]|uniref:hypothetical protein n=1 Tax=Streptomyces sp. NPDC088337 TaxID=3365852 RepID=UPI0038010DC7